jgi:5,6-dimethylbenzimidazole synthase
VVASAEGLPTDGLRVTTDFGTGMTAALAADSGSMPMETTTSAEAVYDAIMRRRDVRSEFTGVAIPPLTLNRLLSAAHAAPSVGLTQPWDFVVIEATETKRRFKEHVGAERQAFCASLPPERANQFAAIKVEGIMEASAGIVVTYDSTRGAPDVLGRHSIADAGLYSACLAIQNLWLAATVENYGVGWVSFYQEEFLRHLVGLPGHVRPVAWLCVGPVSSLQSVPDLERHQWRVRRPVEEAIHREHW